LLIGLLVGGGVSWVLARKHYERFYGGAWLVYNKLSRSLQNDILRAPQRCLRHYDLLEVLEEVDRKPVVVRGGEG